jgi:hypothetical protein
MIIQKTSFNREKEGWKLPVACLGIGLTERDLHILQGDGFLNREITFPGGCEGHITLVYRSEDDQVEKALTKEMARITGSESLPTPPETAGEDSSD